MNLNASIVDQRLQGILSEHVELLTPVVGNNLEKQRSLAFVLLCASTALELNLEEAAELLTEGGNDAGVDALHLGEVDDGEFTVTLFQGKYKHKDLSGNANFPENGVKNALNMLATLFDPGKKVVLNPRLEPRIEEVRSLIRDGYIPNVRLLLCNNGTRWNDQAQDWIAQSGLNGEQVQWIHYNHDNIVAVLQRRKAVDDRLQLHGKAVIEEFNYRRVLIGKVCVKEIAALFNRHGDLLLERNIRRYLGMHANRVNSAIHDTLLDPHKRENFYFYNNGITLICRKFAHNALQGDNYQLRLENIQIINGGQTCKTIQQTFNSHGELDSQAEDTYVLIRLYELADDDRDFVREITYATNSQNPVDLRDLRSNDDYQRQLETALAGFGYTYKRQREEGISGSQVITSSTAAEAILAIWRRKPHQAKFMRREHFGKLYHDIFATVNAAQTLLAVQIFRMVENARKRDLGQVDHPFLPYSAHYAAMLIGERLLQESGLRLDEVTHSRHAALQEHLQAYGATYLEDALERIDSALIALYGERDVSLQQLSATFRRGDLLEVLEENIQP